jgi:hypothetical protein
MTFPVIERLGAVLFRTISIYPPDVGVAIGVLDVAYVIGDLRPTDSRELNANYRSRRAAMAGIGRARVGEFDFRTR